MKNLSNKLFPAAKETVFFKGECEFSVLRMNITGFATQEKQLIEDVSKRCFPCLKNGKTIFMSWKELKEPSLYEIEVGTSAVTVKCGREAISPAIRTLSQLAEWKQPLWHLPECRIRDWPDYRRRGLYVECFHGTDLMTLEDYRRMLDTAWEMKFNQVTLGVYGCWTYRWLPHPKEFYFLPPGKFDLRSRQSVRYYSALKGQPMKMNYSPVVAREGFLPELVEYARSLGINISLHFNVLGHNTLLPRLFPEISAKNSFGKPKNLAFCLSNPLTQKILTSIFREVISAAKIKTLHIGLDEVFSLVGLDEDFPARRISPWCRCAECQKYSRRELLLEYVIGLIKSLRAMGIERISLWHDQLTRMNLMADFENRLASEELKEFVVIEYWYYHNIAAGEKKYCFPETGLRKAVVPMAGFAFWGHFEDHTANIIPLLKNEYGGNAFMTEAYGIYSPAFHYNYACLAQSAWNAKEWDGKNFSSLYVKRFFPERNYPGFSRHFAGLREAEKNGIGLLLFSCAAAENYPADRIKEISSLHRELLKKLPALAAKYKADMEYFGTFSSDGELLRMLYVEAARCKFLTEVFHILCTELQWTPTGYTAERSVTEKLLVTIDRFIELFERFYPPYLQIESLRYISMIRDFVTDDIEIIE